MKGGGGLAAAALILLAMAGAAPALAQPAVSIEVLSNRADLISGGDALVRVDLREPGDASRVRVKLGRRDVTDAFAVRPNGRFEGLAGF